MPYRRILVDLAEVADVLLEEDRADGGVAEGMSVSRSSLPLSLVDFTSVPVTLRVGAGFNLPLGRTTTSDDIAFFGNTLQHIQLYLGCARLSDITWKVSRLCLLWESR